MRPSFTKAALARYLSLVCLLCLLSSHGSEAYSKTATESKSRLEIGSFNIQVFGESKVNKPFVRQTLLSIISRYDIIFIQEIRDNNDKAIYDLLTELNTSTGKNYHALVSPRMGRGEMKEQYAYFFDSEVVTALDFYVFDDKLDEFAREPFIARFESLGREFTLAGIHVAPTAVLQELTSLGKVHRDIKKHFADDSMFIMGDFNADCIYYKPAVFGFDFFDKKPRLLISDDMDTTVAPASCAYDRVLAFGEIQDHVGDARTFNFMEEFSYDLASSKLVSDHFPIEFTIEGATTVTVPTPTSKPEAPTTLPDISAPVEIDLSESVCGIQPYMTPAGYCYGSFEKGKKRVPVGCCP